MAGSRSERDRDSGGLSRRELVKSAVAIGGAGALATVTSVTGFTGSARAQTTTAAARQNRQHAWTTFLDDDDRGIAAPPAHRVLLFVDYTGASDQTNEDTGGGGDGGDGDGFDDDEDDGGGFDDDEDDEFGGGWWSLSLLSITDHGTFSQVGDSWWDGSSGDGEEDDEDGGDGGDSGWWDDNGGGSDDGDETDGEQTEAGGDQGDGGDTDGGSSTGGDSDGTTGGGSSGEDWSIDPSARSQMEAALQQLEDAFEWSNAGLLFTVSYSPTYFDRHFDESLPPGVDLRPAQDTIDATRSRADPDDVVAEDYDICIDLASDNPANLLAAELALFGEIDEVNGVAVENDISDIVQQRPRSFPARRTGFVGSGEPSTHIGETGLPEAHDMSLDSAGDDQGDGSGDPIADEIDDNAPLSMGFQSLYEDSVPREDGVTMVHDQTLGGNFEGPGQFGQGSIQHASKLRIDLDHWYDENDLEERTHQMFSPHHDTFEDDVGNTETRSGGTAAVPMRDPDVPDDVARRTQDDALEDGRVGHAQKLARARFDLSRRDTDGEVDGDLETTILRRDFNTTDAVDADEQSALHFVSLMRFNGYMHYVRQAMNGVNFDSADDISNSNLTDVQHTDLENDDIEVDEDGFLDYVTAHRRGNYVVPPITIRALPTPRALQATVTGPGTQPVQNGDTVEITVGGVAVGDIDQSTATFGPVEAVNQARGESPVTAGTGAGGTGELGFEFVVSGFAAGTRTAKFRAQTTDGVEVQGTTTVEISG